MIPPRKCSPITSIASVVDALTSTTDDDGQIAAEIKDGRISQFLVKPMGYIGYRLCMFFSGRVVFSLAALIPVGLFLALNSGALVSRPNCLHLFLFALSVIGSALNQFLLSFLCATLAFWVLETSTFSFVLLAFERLAGGLMFPLDILPSTLQKAFAWSPFACQIYTPVQIFIGRLQGLDAVKALGVQFLWIMVLSAMARRAWFCGLRRYAAVGG